MTMTGLSPHKSQYSFIKILLNLFHFHQIWIFHITTINCSFRLSKQNNTFISECFTFFSSLFFKVFWLLLWFSEVYIISFLFYLSWKCLDRNWRRTDVKLRENGEPWVWEVGFNSTSHSSHGRTRFESDLAGAAMASK